MKIGRYSVQFSATKTEGGHFGGSVLLTWDEADATIEKLVHFHKPFATEEEARKHAEAQTLVRVQDGVW